MTKAMMYSCQDAMYDIVGYSSILQIPAYAGMTVGFAKVPSWETKCKV